MSKTQCASYVRGRMLRATKLDACGNPIEGAGSVVTSKGFTAIGFTANNDEGEEISVPNANNERIIHVPAKPKFLNYSVEATFIKVDPDLFALFTGQRTVVDDAGDVVGFTVDTEVSPADINFALEVWAGVPAGADCGNSGGAEYGYFLLPFLQGGTIGDLSIENSEVTFTITGAVTLDGNSWGQGLHYAVLDQGGSPSLLAEPLKKTEHLLLIKTGMAPPAAHCGARPYLSPSAPALTGGSATATGLSVDFDGTPSGAEPFWVDFGDGEWDYSADGSAITHLYGAAGTYDYVIFRGASTYEGSVSVTA